MTEQPRRRGQSKLTPEQRSMRARLAAQSRWSKSDAREGTSKARASFLARFEREVDPDGTLPPAERARRAEAALKAHMTRMAMRSSTGRST
jgi:hypothetical protein